MFGLKKKSAVTKKRSTDDTPYRLLRVIDKESKSNDDSSFVSPMYGDDNKNDSVESVTISKPVSNYETFGKEGYIKRDEEDPYKEFRSVSSRHKKDEKANNTVEVKEEPQDPFVEEKPVEEAEEPQLFKYDDTIEEENKEIDKSLLEEAFDYKEEEIKEVKPREHRVIEEKPEFSDDDEDEEYDEEFVEPKKEEKDFDYSNYKFPPLSLLEEPQKQDHSNDESIRINCDILNQTLKAFKIDGQVQEYTQGPTFTRYAIRLAPGVLGSKIESIQNDIQRSLEAISLRIENPIPGKPYVGVEVPNKVRRVVSLKELLQTQEYEESKNPVLVPIGLDVEGKVKYTKIQKWPHSLIAGASGSGKSVYINNIVASILFRATPEDVRFFFIDPKQIDLQVYKNLPHLLCPIINEPKQGVVALKWLITEMNRRLALFRELGGVANLDDWNERALEDKSIKKIPYIVCIIDEAADFLMTAGGEAQEAITILAQKSRAAGIHIALAMQKPVASVLSSSIKSNASTRFAFKVTSRTDSMVILDEVGAENLLGYGDMIYYADGLSYRCQAAFVKNQEVLRVIDWVIKHSGPQKFLFNPEDMEKKGVGGTTMSIDPLFRDVARFVVENGKCSSNAMCKRFSIGFNRADSIIIMMEQLHIVSANLGTKPREVLVDEFQLEDILRSIGC